MRVLLLGATGNLGSRVLPALIAHSHTVVCYITIHEGDALDPSTVTKALLSHSCDALINTAHNNFDRKGATHDPEHLPSVAAAAAVEAGRIRGKPLRAWFLGGLGSLEYPGTGGWRIEDYMPAFMTKHHRETEKTLRSITMGELEWTLLCVALMYPVHKDGSVEEVSEPGSHGLAIGVRVPPDWRDSWVRDVPFVGVYLNLVPVIRSYGTKLEDVADMIAERLDVGHWGEFKGQLIGMKERGKSKTV